MNPAPPNWFYVYLLENKQKKAAFEREKRLKYHGNALRNLKMRIGCGDINPTPAKEVRGEAIL